MRKRMKSRFIAALLSPAIAMLLNFPSSTAFFASPRATLFARRAVESSSTPPFDFLSTTRACGREQRWLPLSMVRNRGLEVREEGATPTPGGMTLYIKAGADGTSVGDCPFAHYVRTVLHEKGLEYDLRPSTAETKPQWLVDYYEAKMPALRHRRECYVESDVIAQYLDFFFQEPPLSGKKREAEEANEAVDGFFPAVARYLKHTPDGDAEDGELCKGLEEALRKLEAHLSRKGGEDKDLRTGPYLVGNGESFTLADASLAPKLYHMEVGLEVLKDNAIDVGEQFPAVRKYMDAVFARPSFVEATYPKETVLWGWGNARE